MRSPASLCLLLIGLALCAVPERQGWARRPRRQVEEAPRFLGRLQVLSGAGFALPQDETGNRFFAAYVPVDVELSLRTAGLLSLGLGGIGYLAPFHADACPHPDHPARPNALGAFFGMRLDFNNSRDGSWLSPWVALRAGLVGQDAVPGGPGCTERMLLGFWLGPRAGLDLWLGKAAVTFALGYDYLPRASAITTQLGLTLRLF